MIKKPSWAHFFAAHLTALSLLLCQPVFANPTVRTTTVKQQLLPGKDRVVGTVRAVMQSDVAATEAGAVISVLVSAGDHVIQGQTLVIMDDRKLKAQLAQLVALKQMKQAEVTLAQALSHEADVDYRAYSTSASKEAISEQKLRQSNTSKLTSLAKFQAAEQDVKAVTAQIKQIQVAIEDSRISAPFSGQVTQQYAQPGQWLAQGDPAVKLVATDKLEVWLDVPERFASTLMPLPAQLSLSIGDIQLSSDKLKLLRNVDVRARTFQLVAQLPPQTTLLPGMSALAWVPNGNINDALAVPKDVIVRLGGQALVYRVTEQEKGQTAEAVAVSVLFYQGDTVAIMSDGIKAGDQVVIKGNERLVPGLVTVIAADTLSD